MQKDLGGTAKSFAMTLDIRPQPHTFGTICLVLHGMVHADLLHTVFGFLAKRMHEMLHFTTHKWSRVESVTAPHRSKSSLQRSLQRPNAICQLLCCSAVLPQQGSSKT